MEKFKRFYFSIFIVFVFIVFLLFFNCASRSLIPKKYNKMIGYYAAEEVGETRSKAFDKAKDAIMASIAEMIISDITSQTDYTITKERDYYKKRIMNFSELTLLNIKPEYKDYKMERDGKVRCAMVICFPDKRIDEETVRILENQRTLELEIEELFRKAENQLIERSLNQSLSTYSLIYDYISELFFDREIYLSRLIHKITLLLGSIKSKTDITKERQIYAQVTGVLEGNIFPYRNERFILKTWREMEVMKIIHETDNRGVLIFDLRPLSDCSDTLYLYPAEIEVMPYNLYTDVMDQLADKDMFTIIWKGANVKIESANIKNIEWHKIKGILMWKYIPSKIGISFNFKENSGLDVILDELSINVIEDKESGKDQEYKHNEHLESPIKIKAGGKASFYWVLPHPVINKIRKYYQDRFINIIFQFRFYGKDKRGIVLETNTYKIIMSKRDFEKFK